MPRARVWTTDGIWFSNSKGQRLVCPRCRERPCREPHGQSLCVECAAGAKDRKVTRNRERNGATVKGRPCHWCGAPRGVRGQGRRTCQRCTDLINDVNPLGGWMGFWRRRSYPIVQRCRRCGETKYHHEFEALVPKNPHARRRRIICRDCLAKPLPKRYDRRAEVRLYGVPPRELILRIRGGVCGVCGLPVDPENFHLDHFVPLIRGGSDDLGNLTVAHPRCNAVKNERLLEEVSRDTIDKLRRENDREGIYS